ncbi:MAG: hypothetical protein RIK87_10765 [Fuerstiella sp.]
MAKQGTFSAEIDALASVLGALEGLEPEQQAFVYKTAGERLGLNVPLQKHRSNRTESRIEDDVDDDHVDRDDSLTVKQFMREKQPKTDAERVTCLAYYLTHHRDEPKFKTKSITLLNTEAAQPKMTNPSQTMKNATIQNHYLAAAGTGHKQITALGEDVVEALPDKEAVKAVLENSHRRKPRKKRATSKKRSATKK